VANGAEAVLEERRTGFRVEEVIEIIKAGVADVMVAGEHHGLEGSFDVGEGVSTIYAGERAKLQRAKGWGWRLVQWWRRRIVR
jgi:hypothetical protein